MADEYCSGCGAEVGIGTCMCPDGTPSVKEQRDRYREAMEEALEFLSSPADVTKEQRIANARISLIEALAE